jgi:hypothetical protein
MNSILVFAASCRQILELLSKETIFSLQFFRGYSDFGCRETVELLYVCFTYLCGMGSNTAHLLHHDDSQSVCSQIKKTNLQQLLREWLKHL